MSWSGFRNKKEGPQQGTLFDVREVPSRPVDSPGMRNRNRRAEMMRELPEVQTGTMGHKGYEQIREKIEERRPSETLSWHRQSHANAGRAERANLARKIGNDTTLEPKHIRGIGRIDVGTVAARESGAIGEYRTATFREPPRLELRDSEVAPSTVAHEVGHHVSMTQQGNTPLRGIDQLAQMSTGALLWPAEEARADAFMHQHTRGESDKSYAKIGGFVEKTEYGDVREREGVPLTDREREWAGLPPNILQPKLFGET